MKSSQDNIRNYNQRSTMELMKAIQILLFTLAMASYMVEAGFDLNELPMEAPPENDNSDKTSSKVVDQQATEPPPVKTTTTGKKTKKAPNANRPKTNQPVSQNISPQFYDKFLKMLDKLKVCDKEDFDISNFELPEYFASENRVRLLLIEIGKRDLVRPEHKERYNRIIKNCGDIQKAMTKRDEDDPFGRSEMAGYTFPDDNQQKYDHSPLEALKANAATVFNKHFQQQQSAKMAQKTSGPPPPYQPEGIGRLEPAYTSGRPNKEPTRTFFNFI